MLVVVGRDVVVVVEVVVEEGVVLEV